MAESQETLIAHEADLWTVDPDGRIYCHLCPNACHIHEGHRGICGARGVEGGKLMAMTYGLISSLAIDPIEKKPVFHYCPGVDVLSLGSVGCSMRCGHCQNWQISRPKGADGSVPLRYVEPLTVVETAEAEGCPGIAYTYNEPAIWLEYVRDVGRIAHERGLFNIMVTNGYVTEEGLDAFAEVVDVWRTDIKGFSEASYRRLCKVSTAEPVRAAAERAKNVHGMHVECVTNVVPTVNDSDEELGAVAEWIADSLGPDTPWHVTRFVPYLEFADLEPTPIETLEHARELGSEAGLKYVFMGNVQVPGGEDTICWVCGQVAVARRGYTTRKTGIDAGAHCTNCGTKLAIRMDRCG